MLAIPALTTSTPSVRRTSSKPLNRGFAGATAGGGAGTAASAEAAGDTSTSQSATNRPVLLPYMPISVLLSAGWVARTSLSGHFQRRSLGAPFGKELSNSSGNRPWRRPGAAARD